MLGAMFPPRPHELTEGQKALRRLMALGVALVALLLVGVAGLLAGGSKALDDLQAREDRALVHSAVDRALRRIVSDTTTATVWDQAYSEFRPGGSLKWADEEVGSYFAYNRGHDITVAIDGRGVPFYAWVGPRRATPTGQGRFLADVAPLIQRARAIEAARKARAPMLPPTNPNLAETASGIVVSNGVAYLVAVSTVTPENAQAPRRPGPAMLVVTAQRMDGHLLRSLSELQIRHARIEAEPRWPAGAIPLHDVHGRFAGWLSWEPERPGLRVLAEAAPAVALGLLAVGAVLAALGWQILRVARRLGGHERALTTAMRDLADARDRAEEANVAKSQFLTNMSHEIRTPLNGVLGMAQLMARSDLAPADHEKVQVIRTSGEALLALLNDILDLSKVEAGHMELDVRPFDLEQAVETATRGFAVIAAQKGVGFLVEVEPAVRGVWLGDGGRVRQVLANLASNAVKFTAAGEVRVRVRRTDEGFACTVSDSGVGIAPDRLPRLFQRFSQVDPSATRKYGGTGLGLAISKEFVELMGGRVSVTSVEGRGSAFSFDLPLEWLHAPVSVVASPSGGGDRPMPRLRVLAAEDNVTNQRLLAAMLEPLGVALTMVVDGAEAVDAFTAERFDLVLMDVQMPTMNGVDATRAIRALEAARGEAATPIIAVSANVMSHQIEEYLAAGMNGFVAKPVEIAALVDAIERALAAAPESDIAREAAA